VQDVSMRSRIQHVVAYLATVRKNGQAPPRR
jgi:hypothetical protein